MRLKTEASTCTCRGGRRGDCLLDEVSCVSLRMSSHSWGKNSSWCTGWESQQQRRKLRPGSQISSASAAVQDTTGCFGRTHVFITLRPSVVRLHVHALSSSVRLGGVTRLAWRLWIKCLRVRQMASGKQESMSCSIQACSDQHWLLLSNFSPSCRPHWEWESLHYSAGGQLLC